ncbi:hypothetical protein RHGRI_020462 [Rhododendron griersonianum]|uniref:AIR9-like A9 domain-containing protein n=1 Tax=Rhododendron griersonianum TaxID=479676 RepID=A0AAV6JGC7_9ERIC|nr:hypothetical protein RHGRI_020462 [Rhododendron griersonianum]
MQAQPSVNDVQIIGEVVEGGTIKGVGKYFGGREGLSKFEWLGREHRNIGLVFYYQVISSDGNQTEVIDATTASYILSVDDIGYLVFVSCEPVRCDWARGPIVLSEQIRPIILGDCFYEWFRLESNGIKDKLNAGGKVLGLAFGGCRKMSELVYTPVRKDGVKGSATCVLSTAVSPVFVVIAEPMGVELVIPGCCEDQIVVPQKTYFGGQESVGEYVWYRTKNKLNEADLMDITVMCEDVHVCGQRLTCTPTLEDVGVYLALYWQPTRADGKCGKPLVSSCYSRGTPGTTFMFFT